MSLPDVRNFKVSALSDEQVEALKRSASRARVNSLTMVAAANSGHPGGAFSSMEMFMSVYAVADVTPGNCSELDRDYVVVSHGHTSAGVYSALAEWGFFSADEAAANFRRCGSPYQGHVERDVPGVDWGTGNLGQGLSAGVGFALAQRARGCGKKRVYVLMGDGGQVKGQIAESRRLAAKEKLTGIIAMIDWNDIQISGHLKEVMPANLKALWEADGWEVTECDGHNFKELYSALKNAGTNGKPTVLFCRTVMGKDGGVMEGTHEYHGKAAQGEVYDNIVKSLGSAPSVLKSALDRRKGAIPSGRHVGYFKPVLDLGKPFDYEAAKSDNRGAFGKALADVGKLNRSQSGKTPILVFDCDLAPSVMTNDFKKECPEGFIQCGIQEHSTATTSGAAAAAGVVSVWADFGVFGLSEVYNQQRLNDINHAGNKTVLTHVGLDVGEDGKTHQCIDYVGLLHNTFGWKLVVPADPNQTDRATRWMLGSPDSICLAMGRSKLPVLTDVFGKSIFGGDYKFEYGKAIKIRSGKDGVIFALGAMTQKALEAQAILAGKGLEVAVWSISCPLTVDEAALEEACSAGVLLTVEDHNVNTGMGSIVAVELARRGKAVKLCLMGVTRYGDSGPASDVYAALGLDAQSIADAFIKTKR